MKKYKWPIIAGIAIVVGAIYVFWNPPSTKDAYEYWKGSYAELKRVTATDEFIKLKAIADLREQNSLLQGSIDSANTIIAQKEQENAQANTDLANARKGWGTHTAEAQAKLRELDAAWAKKFDILLKQDQEKDKIIFSLMKQYQAEIKVSEGYRSLWENEKALRLKCEVGIGLSDKRIASLNRQVKTTRILAVLAVGATLLLKK